MKISQHAEKVAVAEQMATLGDIFGNEAQTGAGWFGSGSPIRPIAPSEVAGRQFDLPFSYNRLIYPKQGDRSSVTPAQLRALSESWDILRAIIETRKDQGVNVPLKFRDRDAAVGAKPSKKALDAAKFFRKPDGRHTLSAWRRMLREDLYVLDAPTIYQEGRYGSVSAFEVIDGATIKVLSDNWGRVPLEGPAYQQILKGATAVNYTAEQIVYTPRNPRPHKFYGFSPVEQSVITIDTGMRRTLGQLYHFSEGNVPEAFIKCPETWNPDQVKAMQEYWDAIMSGNLKARAGARFIPGGAEPIFPKIDALLKGEFDEWCARIMCYFFSVSPQPFVREMNRATAHVSDSASMRDGVLSELTWEKDLFDDLLERMGMPEVEAYHDTTVAPDAKTKNEIVLAQVKAGIRSEASARRELGIPEEDAPEKVEPAKDEKPAGKCDHDHGDAHKADDLPPMDNEVALMNVVQGALDDLKNKAQDIAQAAYSGEKLPELDFTKSGRKAFVKAVRVELGEAAVLATAQASKLVSASADLALLEAPAKAWAAGRAAWLVGMKWEGKTLIPNPNAEYRITDEVRDAVRRQVTRAFEERLTPGQLAENLASDQAFSPKRALVIARTEIAEAQEAGSMIYYKAAGVPRKRWSGAANCCPLCQANEDAGPIGINAEFPSGHQHAPAHPNDRCRVLPVEDNA